MNCSVGLTKKRERIDLIVEAARRFLGVVGISGEELDRVLREELPSAPAQAGSE